MLDGVFSFVLLDTRHNIFIAARDAIGITPLYVGWGLDGTWNQNFRIVFIPTSPTYIFLIIEDFFFYRFRLDIIWNERAEWWLQPFRSLSSRTFVFQQNKKLQEMVQPTLVLGDYPISSIWNRRPEEGLWESTVAYFLNLSHINKILISIIQYFDHVISAIWHEKY